MLWNTLIGIPAIGQFILGGVLSLVVIAAIWAMVQMFEFCERHPLAVNGSALCAFVLLWFLCDGTWFAGVLGLCSATALGFLISAIYRIKERALIHG